MIAAFCDVVVLGSLPRQGNARWLETLQRYANRSRWRIRETAAIALQICASAHPGQALDWMQVLAKGSLLKQRTPVAALCEPVIRMDPGVCGQALQIPGDITSRMGKQTERNHDDFRVLRQVPGYGWSVALAATPEARKIAFKAWLDSPNADVRRVMRKNFGKKRQKRLDQGWVMACQA